MCSRGVFEVGREVGDQQAKGSFLAQSLYQFLRIISPLLHLLQLKTIASMAGAVDAQVKAVKAAAGTPGATPTSAINEVKSVLDSLKSSTTK